MQFGIVERGKTGEGLMAHPRGKRRPCESAHRGLTLFWSLLAIRKEFHRFYSFGSMSSHGERGLDQTEAAMQVRSAGPCNHTLCRKG